MFMTEIALLGREIAAVSSREMHHDRLDRPIGTLHTQGVAESLLM